MTFKNCSVGGFWVSGGGVSLREITRWLPPLCSLLLPSEEMCDFVLLPMPHHDVLTSKDPSTKSLLSHGRDLLPPPKTCKQKTFPAISRLSQVFVQVTES